jgi:iron complex transport system ATP-binding protein
VTAALEARDLRVGYRRGRRARLVVLDDVSLTLAAGEFACLVGPNGTGKSTLLRTCSGLQPPLGGQVLLGGDDLRELARLDVARRVAAVLTDHHDTGRLTGRDLVGLGRYPYTGWFGRLDPDDDRLVATALETVSAAALGDRVVAELSDGERQRVMIARALAQQPSVLILDEPAAFLDVTARVELVALLRRLTREQGLAVVLATHDLELALRSADTIWVLDADRRLDTGLPEDLAARGVLGRAFPSGSWAFDPMQWRFVFCGEVHGVATVAGDSLHARLARRILEREGFMVDPPDHGVAVHLALEVLERPRSAPTVIARHAGGVETHQALRPLADLARRVAATRRPPPAAR